MSTFLLLFVMMTMLTYSILPVCAQSRSNSSFRGSRTNQIAARSVSVDVVGNRNYSAAYPRNLQNTSSPPVLTYPPSSRYPSGSAYPSSSNSPSGSAYGQGSNSPSGSTYGPGPNSPAASAYGQSSNSPSASAYPQSNQYPAGAYATAPVDYSNGVSTADNNSWSSADNGSANAYDYTASAATQSDAYLGSMGAYTRRPAQPAMSNADVEAARRAILDGSFFRWHGTQSSRISRNR